MDFLQDVFDTLGLKGALYFRTDFSGPWAVTVPELGQAARFHFMVQGECHVTFPSGTSHLLRSGDLILIPGGRTHILADRKVREAPPLETVLDAVGYDGRGLLVVKGEGRDEGMAEPGARTMVQTGPQTGTKMICGHLNFRDGASHPLLRALPDCLVTTPEERAREPLLDEMLRLIQRRMFSESLGSEAAVTRMSEIVFVELLRTGVGRVATDNPVLEAFRDRRIGRALELIHTDPGAKWSVDRLAGEVGMSRSRFSDRFSALLGSGPMAYLAEWRLQKALPMLENARTSIQEIAYRTGYGSTAAFTRAFSDRFGQSPSAYRKMVA